MKHLLIVLISILIVTPSFSQNSKDDLRQEIAELRNDIKDIEAEIADAKINYPEDVPELEKELAATKKMLTAFEKMAGMPSGPNPAPVKAAPVAKPSYNSPVVPIHLSNPVTVPLPEQATDKLLWYTGKKINDSTLVTTKELVVQHQPSKSRVVIQPEEKGDPFKKMVEELKKSEQRKNEIIDKVAKLKNGTLYYPQLVLALKYYDDFDERFKDVVKNTIDLPPPMSMPGSTDGMPSGGHKGGPALPEMTSYFDMDQYIVTLKARLKEARAMFEALPPIENIPTPPEHQLGVCVTCDKSIIEKERKADSDWSESYLGKEAEIMRIVLGVYREATLLGIEIDDPEIWSLYDFEEKIFERADRRDNLLFKKYGKDLKRSTLIAQTVLGRERQKILLGFGEGDPGILPTLLQNNDSSYIAYFKEQMGLKNYNFIFDFSRHLGWEREKQLLGASDGTENNEYWDKVVMRSINENRFALTLDLDFIYEKLDDEKNLEMKATGSMATKDKVFVRLYPDSCSWHLVLFDADYNNATEQLTSIPLKFKTGEKTLLDEDDNLVTYPYSGPENIVAYFPQFRIDLCDISKKDSAVMMPMNYPYGYKPGSLDLRKSYKEDMIGIGNHMLIDIDKVEGSESEGMEMAAEVIANVTQSQVTKPTGNAKLDKMQGDYNLKLKQDSYKKKVSEMGLNKKSVFLFNANNGSTVFIDQYNDTKHTIDENTKLVKGLIHLRVVHDPVTN